MEGKQGEPHLFQLGDIHEPNESRLLIAKLFSIRQRLYEIPFYPVSSSCNSGRDDADPLKRTS